MYINVCFHAYSMSNTFRYVRKFNESCGITWIALLFIIKTYDLLKWNLSLCFKKKKKQRVSGWNLLALMIFDYTVFVIGDIWGCSHTFISVAWLFWSILQIAVQYVPVRGEINTHWSGDDSRVRSTWMSVNSRLVMCLNWSMKRH